MANIPQLCRSSLHGRTAAITGATGGIGYAVAERFLREGAQVVFLGRDPQKLKVAAQKPVSRHLHHETTAERIRSHVLDVRVEQSWADAIARFPDVDILVNCAGITQRSLLVRTSQDTIRDILETNLVGTINGCKQFAHHWISKRRRDCCIINISSLLATKGASGTSVYAASKAGIIGLTTSLAAELLHRDIRVNAILPGYIDTTMTDAPTPGDNPDAGAAQKIEIPVARFGTPDEVADAAVFLAKNNYANNCILNLDGGLSAI